MRVVVIGGTGHIGTFLVPRLVRAGHEVISLSRGTRAPYADAPEWQQVRHVAADRQQEDAAGTFGSRVAGLRPDAVVDLVCFTPDAAAALVGHLRGATGHLLHCGTMWRYGPSHRVPITEADGTPPVGEYGILKDRIARMLKQETASGGLTTTSLHPGHIVGPGWQPIGPLGNLDPGVWAALSAGHPLRIPGTGAELMHHVHADDVAQAFERALERRDAAAGEDFNVVAPSALNVRGYAHAVAGWFGRTAKLEPVTWQEFRGSTTAEFAGMSWDHLHRSQCLSIDKARTLLGYAPRYEPEDALLESVRWLVAHDRLRVAVPLAV
ncbi:NAD-dependent epimerase/dehydratase family protein [Actinacidiphila acidipaludis]|uniref:NAD(P)-dependent oxidoreductase n=1 Tax=Actinacidiphila acidipaludis TaxID=2873382 RepID=A0ABS7Q958_9ACTN|nr:NAD(P)-dependent oxidoreductase [Streptomyces acidipaludis]MBY8879688.1 NAD(P)-dependent oxidoreductase [Streptomyces acidipaludis]